MGRWTRGLRQECRGWIELAVRAWPATPSGERLRRWYWCRRLRVRGPLYVGRMAEIGPPQLVHLEPGCAVGEYDQLLANDSRGIFVGSGALLAPHVLVRAANHAHSDPDRPIRLQGHTCASMPYRGREYSVVIEHDAWVGANVTLLSGAQVGHDSIVGAGAVVTGVIPPFSVAVGNPARVLRDRREIRTASAAAVQEGDPTR